MKVRNYEKKTLIVFISIILFILEIFFLMIISIKKEYNYTKVTGIVLKENLLIIVASKEERKNFYNNSHIYLDSKKRKMKIIEDRGAIITKDNKKYYELLIKVKFTKKYKANDIIPISIKTEKKRLIEIFKIIGEGG